MEKKALKQFLKEAAALSLELQGPSSSSDRVVGRPSNHDRVGIAVARLRSLVSGVSQSLLGIALPTKHAMKQFTAAVYYSSVYENEAMHASIFGFCTKNAKIPLHDHPEMHGFIKVLHGTIRVKSYSLMSKNEGDVATSLASSTTAGGRLVRFDGEVICSPDDDCLYLGPRRNNVHSVTALEDGAAFFDLLVPGYGNRPCTYYEPQAKMAPKVSETVFLNKIPTPVSYGCHNILFDSLACVRAYGDCEPNALR